MERKAEVATMVRADGLTWRVGAPALDRCPPLPEGRPKVVSKSKIQLERQGEDPLALSKGERVFVLSEAGGLSTLALLDGTQGTAPAKSRKERTPRRRGVPTRPPAGRHRPSWTQKRWRACGAPR